MNEQFWNAIESANYELCQDLIDNTNNYFERRNMLLSSNGRDNIPSALHYVVKHFYELDIVSKYLSSTIYPDVETTGDVEDIKKIRNYSPKHIWLA